MSEAMSSRAAEAEEVGGTNGDVELLHRGYIFYAEIILTLSDWSYNLMFFYFFLFFTEIYPNLV